MYEKEKLGKLPFLAVCVQRRGNTISTTVYKKATHPDQYINFSSHHHPRIKAGVVHCRGLTTSVMRVQSTMSVNTFEANSYPRRLGQQVATKS